MASLSPALRSAALLTLPAPCTPALAAPVNTSPTSDPHQPNKASRKILDLSILGLMVFCFVLGIIGKVLHPFCDRDGEKYLGKLTRAMVEKTSSPKTPNGKLRYLFKITGGERFGNQMFKWASTLGMAKRYWLIPCIDAYLIVQSMFTPFVMENIP